MGIVIMIAAQVANSFEPDRSISLKPRPIILNFLSIAKEPQFYTYAFTGAIAFSGLFTYVAASPLYLWTLFKVDAKRMDWLLHLCR
jgi:DHA1 family bicyclomycin/chloramphenicol resistance-like MFS transporter